jgi:cytoskeletal protein CcmA (bactofilin family)
MSTAAPGVFAHIGKSLSIKGELSGSEDVYVDGQLDGTVQLSGSSFTIGPNGHVHADLVAKNVTVAGKLDGNIQASERTELRKTAVVNGDLQTRRIAIEEGAYFKGKLEILQDAKASSGSATAASGGGTTAPGK